MSVFRLFLAEMAKLAAKKGVLISVIAALLVPVVYGGILLSPTWGPYDNLSNLPVAVVNKDKGALSNDEPINVGQDLVADLKKGQDLGWDFVSSAEAKKGLDSLKYYMVIEIPEDFSQRVTTVLEDNPQKLELRYIQNEGLNFMAAQVTRSATEKLREKLGDKITEKYASNMFASLGDVSDGFQKAADGSGKLNTGITDLHDGTSLLLESLTNKATDISKLANGAKELQNGTGQMVNSLSAKQADISKLANGSQQLSAGTAEMLQSLQAKSGDISKLAAGSEAANEGTGLLLQGLKDKQSGIKDLAAGAKQLGDNIPQLKQGTSGVLTGLKGVQSAIKSELAPGTQAVSAGVNTVVDESKQLGAGLQVLSADLQAFLKQHPELQTDPAFMKIFGTSQALAQKTADPAKGQQLAALQQGAASIAAAFTANEVPNPKSLADGVNQLVAGQTLVDNGVTTLSEKVPLLQQGTASVESGWNTMVGKVGELHAGTSQIAAGNQSVNTGWTALTTGVTQLNDGAKQISAGNSTVEKGWRDLTAGATKINSGMLQVKDGNTSVEKGWGELTDGVTKLNDGAGQLNDGSNELSTGLKDGAEKTSAIKAATDKNLSMFSSPVELKSETVNKYPLYRDSTAPYVLSLALFVGILIMSLFINFKKPEGISAISWFGAKFMNLGALAIVQALLLSTVVLLFLHVKVQNPVGFIAFAVFVSIVFTGIVLFFASFGNIGRFIAFALVILQLSTTGANLPIAMLPENLRALSEFLPFTYSIAGFKALITLNHTSSAFANMSVLLIYLLAFSLLSIAVFMFTKTKSQPQKLDLAS
ncbi:YhgE/Pip domain-containing protein [Fictibacillus sp. b24]|uniref:YhgE/Pip family protein n=1 Tax=Fictibacillus sp. b24 TaxID=3055863 RepID=UPI0025A0BAB1|nr:YhgE/Pip domain-containing protein [Fictibacillus sp. b24]MDM5317907.1 YhgE/Pip domain-containing protein [Fictibacillus sp. b24]